MKTFLVCLVILFIFFSCSTDDNLFNPELDRLSEIVVDKNNAIPANASNLYDKVGTDFYNSLVYYNRNYGYVTTKEEIIKQMIFLSQSNRLPSLTSKSTITLTSEMVTEILADPELKLIELIEETNLSLEVKTNLSGFVTDLIEQRENDYDVVYASIVVYESNINNNPILDNDEKSTVLKVSSVARYSLYAEARRRDRDWETNVTNKKSPSTYSSTPITLVTLCVLFDALQ